MSPVQPVVGRRGRITPTRARRAAVGHVTHRREVTRHALGHVTRGAASAASANMAEPLPFRPTTPTDVVASVLDRVVAAATGRKRMRGLDGRRAGAGGRTAGSPAVAGARASGSS